MPKNKKRAVSIASLFRNRNFALLWTGSMTSYTGFFVVTIAFDWYIYTTTGQTLLLTLLGIVEFIPTLSLGIVAGALVDRYDRRRVMILSDVIRALALGALALYVLCYGFNLYFLLGTVFLTSAIGTFFGPASNALLPRLVVKDDLTQANGLLTVGTTIAQFIGNPLGGLLITLVGVGAGLAYNSVTYAVSAICITLLAIPASRALAQKEPGEKPSSIWRDTGEGLRYIRSQPPLLLMTVVSMVANFFSFYNLYMVIYTTRVLGMGAAIFGILLGVLAIGAGIGGILVHHLRLDNDPGLWIPLTWGMTGLPLISLALLPYLPFALASMLALGVFNSVVNVTFLSTVQRVVPDRLLGRYLATDQSLVFAMIPAGIVGGGFLVLHFGVGPAFLIAGVGTALVAWSLLLNPGVREWGRRRSTDSVPDVKVTLG